MNGMQYVRNDLVDGAKRRAKEAERELHEARMELAYRRAQLEQAIDDDPESWHNTPGILK